MQLNIIRQELSSSTVKFHDQIKSNINIKSDASEAKRSRLGPSEDGLFPGSELEPAARLEVFSWPFGWVWVVAESFIKLEDQVTPWVTEPKIEFGEKVRHLPSRKTRKSCWQLEERIGLETLEHGWTGTEAAAAGSPILAAVMECMLGSLELEQLACCLGASCSSTRVLGKSCKQRTKFPLLKSAWHITKAHDNRTPVFACTLQMLHAFFESILAVAPCWGTSGSWSWRQTVADVAGYLLVIFLAGNDFLGWCITLPMTKVKPPTFWN